MNARLVLFILLMVGCADMAMGAKDSMQILKETYNDPYCRALELAYGDNLMAEGGNEEIDHMFQDLDLSNKRVLDFGSGLGGVAFHVAKTYGAEVTGVELNPNLVTSAEARTPADLKGRVHFLITPDGVRLPMDDNSFDVVYSKGVNVHLTHDQLKGVLREFHRVLKPGGLLIIGDWISKQEDKWGPRMTYIMESECLPLFARTQGSYLKELDTAGFKVKHVTDRSKAFASYNRDIVHRLSSEPVRSKFVSEFGKEDLAAHVKGYEHINAANMSGELVTILIRAEKV